MTFGECTVHCFCTIKDLVKQTSGQCVIPAKKKKGKWFYVSVLMLLQRSYLRNDVMLIKSTFSPSFFRDCDTYIHTVFIIVVYAAPWCS